MCEIKIKTKLTIYKFIKTLIFTNFFAEAWIKEKTKKSLNKRKKKTTQKHTFKTLLTLRPKINKKAKLKSQNIPKNKNMKVMTTLNSLNKIPGVNQ